MTEKQYDVIYEKEPRGQVVTDNGIPCTARTCCTRLNRLTEENKELQVQCNLLREQSNEFHRGARENANGVGQLEKENKELKEENEQLKHDATVLICSNQEYRKKNEQLKKQLSEAKADEKQLGISFMGYKMKLIEVLRKKYDKVKGKTLYADVYTEIAEEMGVDLE